MTAVDPIGADPISAATIDATPIDATPSAERPVEHLDVLVVGAGLSGIGAGHYLQTECPWASYAIFEARGAIGGTWDLFRYPGIRSDSDMFTLGYSFRPWDGEKSIADGASILQYIKDTAAESGVDRHIRFHHRIISAEWSTEDARWAITAERTDPDHPDAAAETVRLTCGFVFSCSGYYRYDRGHQPEFPGADTFGGTVVHPQFWPEDLDYADKRVVVIGSGATAITLVPSMARTAAHVTMLQRSPTYVISLPEKNPLANAVRSVSASRRAGQAIRWWNAIVTQGSYQLSRRRPELVKRIIRKGIEEQLPAGYDVATHFTPTYNPWDQRLCVVPNGDLFRAISDGSASVVTDHIDTFTPTGIRLESGAELEADIIVSATGLELLFIGGIEVSVDGEVVDLPSRLTYKGMMIEGVPNFAVAVGYTNASWTLKCDLTCDYVCRLLNRLHDTGLRQCMPINHDPSVTPSPLLDLSAGYITRAAGRIPSQGSKFPWRVHQSYLADHRAMKKADLDDEAMSFSNPSHRKGPSIMNHPNGHVAAITGAGSGIGRALAIALAQRGVGLALSDVDEAGLAETVGLCEGRGVKVTSEIVDVADRSAVEAWADRVVDEHGSVNYIFNNAGVALGATVETMSYEDFEWLMNINFWGVVHGTKAFLPHLKAAGSGHIVNISSVFGLISVPTQSAYNASKFAVRGFSDALRMELEAEGSKVSVTTIHPGGVRTSIARSARVTDELASGAGGDHAKEFDKIARTTPAQAAEQILAAVDKNRRRATVGPDGRALDFISRLPAGLYQRALIGIAKRRG